MSLRDNQVRATVAVSDIARAKEFYEGRLGLVPQEGGPDQVSIYECGNGSLLQVFVEELAAAGVEPARYDAPEGDERGVHDNGSSG